MNIWRQLAYYFSLITYFGVLIASCIFVGYFLGSYLDRLLAINMMFTIIGVVIGSIAGLYFMYKTAIRMI